MLHLQPSPASGVRQRTGEKDMATKPTGRSEVIARLRKEEGYNDKRFVAPVAHGCDEECIGCDCDKPQDNDQSVCMACGGWIHYGSRA